MKTISYTALRADLSKKMNQVCEDHAPYIVTRSKAEPVVMISLEDYESMKETCYLLKSPANAAKLAAAVDEVEALIAKDKASKKDDK